MEKATVDVFTIHHPAGLKCICKQCQTILAKGYFLVGVKITYSPERELKFVLGVTPPMFHCGKDAKVYHLFESEKEAREMVSKTIKHLNDRGRTDDLKLFTFQLISFQELN